jgi:hypothetical protein
MKDKETKIIDFDLSDPKTFCPKIKIDFTNGKFVTAENLIRSLEVDKGDISIRIVGMDLFRHYERNVAEQIKKEPPTENFEATYVTPNDLGYSEQVPFQAVLNQAMRSGLKKMTIVEAYNALVAYDQKISKNSTIMAITEETIKGHVYMEGRESYLILFSTDKKNQLGLMSFKIPPKSGLRYEPISLEEYIIGKKELKTLTLVFKT